MARNSRAPGFYKLSLAQRRATLAEQAGLRPEDLARLDVPLPLDVAEKMVENVVGLAALPLAVAQNFVLNGQDVLVPMAIEEPSVVAAASNAARMVREGGGFAAESTPPVMIAQVEVRQVADPAAASERLNLARSAILTAVDQVHQRLKARGGGAVDLVVRILEEGPMGRLVVDVALDCRDAMGANLCNTAAEAVAPQIARLAQGEPGLRILSNLSDRRLTTVRAKVPVARVGGANLAGAIAEASRFAELDPYRAATHNKGIMNGVDAVALATGQDWRALEAGAHAFAARSGRYGPLSRWWVDGDSLCSEMTIPLAVGTVGGALRAHPGVQIALRIAGTRGATDLAQLIAAAGLATNLAALKALAGEGIQRGHMRLHERYRG